MILEFKQQQNAEATGVGDEPAAEAETEQTMETQDLLNKITRWQKGANTVTVAISEAFQHLEAQNWHPDALYGHAHFLFDTLQSSKEVAEDVFGYGADRKRANKNPFQSNTVERFWQSSLERLRLPNEEWTRVLPNEQDYEATYNDQPSRVPFVFRNEKAGTTVKAFKALAAKKHQTGLAGGSQGLNWRKQSGGTLGVEQDSRFDLESDIRPASNLADYKSVGSLIVLKAARVRHFQDVAGFWASELMQQGRVFLEQASGDFFLSLGTYGGGGLGWALKVVGDGDRYFQLSDSHEITQKDAALKLQSFATNILSGVAIPREEEFLGVPTKVCIPSNMPQLFDQPCVLLERTGEPEPLVKFFLLHGCAQDLSTDCDVLKQLLFMNKLTATCYKEKKAGKQHLGKKVNFSAGSEENEVQQEWFKPYLHDVLSKLGGEEDFREFEDLQNNANEMLRAEFIYSRVGGSKQKASRWTPVCIKDLRPPGSVLVWQTPMHAFQGYYPLPESERAKAKAAAAKASSRKRRVQTHVSTSRSYGERRTQLSALTSVVQWLWKAHEKAGEETCLVYTLLAVC
eukprot:s1187_g4.t1